MRARTDPGEKKLVLVKPAQSRRVAQKTVRVAAKDGYGICGERVMLQNRVGDLGPIGLERQVVFLTWVVRETLGFAVGQHLDVNLIGCQEAAASANERDHVPVRRQCGRKRRIRK